MKVHNSTEMSQSDYQDNKFYIKYQQATPKRRKPRYLSDKQTEKPRALTSQADNYKLQKSLVQERKSQQPATQRYQRKKMSLVTASFVFGSMMEIIEQDKTHLDNRVSKRQQRQMPRIPIQFNDQKANGLLADLQRLKVVYRGYAPKNTYYFFKALTSKSCFLDIKTKSRSDFQLQFDSKFESGNLSAAARKSSKQYWLYIREDTNTVGLRQWFNFTIFNRKVGKFKFRIYKFSKFYSLYKEGMKPFIKDDKNLQSWIQKGQNVKYEYDQQLKSHYLQFQYQFTEKYLTTECASQPPYTYSMLKNYLQLASQKYPYLKLRKAGSSLAGLQIPQIQIKKKSKSHQKLAIIIIARTHPSQVASNYALQSFIHRIYEIQILLETFDFYIIPMVNPDGVFLGNHRTGVLGQDLNRNFHSQDSQFFPQIDVVQKLIERVKLNHNNVPFMFDLHGHSAKRNIFAYGDDHMIGSLSYLNSRIIPKLLSDTISTFKYNYCVFRGSKEKKNTARVYLSKKYSLNIITFEQSYGMIDQGPIGIMHWKDFGEALADSLKDYIQTCGNGNEQKMREYLEVQMKKQREKRQKKIKKKLLDRQKSQSEKLTQDFKIQKCSINQMDTFKKIKTQNNTGKNETFEFQLPRQKRKDSLSSINQSELSSGDEELQNDQQGLEALKRQIIKIGCLKDGAKREKFNIAEKQLQMRGNYQPRLHQQRSSMIPRILKYQMRKKQQEKQQQLSYNFHRGAEQKSNRKKMKSKIVEKTERESIELPSLRR